MFRLSFLIAILPLSLAAETTVHGLWIWKTPSVLAPSTSANAVLHFCQSQGIDEVYVSTSQELEQNPTQLAALIALLHQSNIKVEALLSSNNADEPGPPRRKLLSEVQDVLTFNRSQPQNRFDGIHLDIEPQQRPENKGAGNLEFLPNLIAAFRDVRALAETQQLNVNADIAIKVLKGTSEQRQMLLSALPRLTLMLYELGGTDPSQQKTKLINSATTDLSNAYQGLDSRGLAKIIIALRTPDYGSQLPAMLKTLDDTFGPNTNYLGWAWHSYNDSAAFSDQKTVP